MRLSAALVSLNVVLGASPAYANCVPGEKVISPGYKVMVKCNDYPKGTMSPAPSTEDCALRCEGTVNICSYEPKSKQCIVASANGTPAKLTGVISMTPIKSDCCPDLETCREENTKCAADLADALKQLGEKDKELTKAKKDLFDANKQLEQKQKDLDEANKKVQQSQKDLDSCRNPAGSGPPPNQKPLNPATCGELKSVNPRVPLIRQIQANYEKCKSACMAEPKCQAYNVFHFTGSQKDGGCFLYAKPVEELTTVINKNWRLYNRGC
ncbi:uncharacterized protein FMAN_05313 [Fusarium mangiferae]|uniref:Apple domain-containing protein n=1 Tax=Fusarium mangiferae TaxID=192010 RepID=A0A1L7SXN6_FUSMA|nr:uncharacterized protein FMAN_05313 [Fusarium mangiferae]CVK87861.1 uncharacterized protein FMAN_05313 [Fusarium mangiferae]